MERALRGATRDDGKPIVQAVLRNGPDARTAASMSLPDLIVHWTDAVFASPLRLRAPASPPRPSAAVTWASTRFGGFYPLKPARGEPLPDGTPVAAEALPRLLLPDGAGASR